MHPDKLKIDRIQNDRISATADNNMRNIWQTMIVC